MMIKSLLLHDADVNPKLTGDNALASTRRSLVDHEHELDCMIRIMVILCKRFLLVTLQKDHALPHAKTV